MDDDNGNLRVVQHVLADAADQRTDAADATGAEQDRVVVALDRFCHDLRPGFALAEDRRCGNIVGEAVYGFAKHAFGLGVGVFLKLLAADGRAPKPAASIGFGATEINEPTVVPTARGQGRGEREFRVARPVDRHEQTVEVQLLELEPVFRHRRPGYYRTGRAGARRRRGSGYPPLPVRNSD